MPDRNQNLIGKHFDHLTVLAKSKERGTQNEYKWICRCDCGRWRYRVAIQYERKFEPFLSPFKYHNNN